MEGEAGKGGATEVVNFYFKLLDERARRAGAKHAFFSSYLFEYNPEAPGLYDYDQTVRRAGKRLREMDLLGQKQLFVPLNVLNTHWVLVVVDVPRREARSARTLSHVSN